MKYLVDTSGHTKKGLAHTSTDQGAPSYNLSSRSVTTPNTATHFSVESSLLSQLPFYNILRRKPN